MMQRYLLPSEPESFPLLASKKKRPNPKSAPTPTKPKIFAFFTEEEDLDDEKDIWDEIEILEEDETEEYDFRHTSRTMSNYPQSPRPFIKR